MTTSTATSEVGTATRVQPAAESPPAEWRSSMIWLRRSVVALAVVTVTLAVTGLFLTFRYRPASRVDGAGVASRSALVDAAHLLHTAGAYAFVALVCVVVGIASLVANQRDRVPGVILASGFGLFLVSIGFLVTGLQLPWRGFVWVASGFDRSFDGVVAFPPEVVSVMVGQGEVSPARYETIAWIHIAGLPVFGVFAAWWLLGAIQASRPAEPVAPTATPTGTAGRSAPAVPAPPPEPARRATLAEQLFGTDDPETVRRQVDTFLSRHMGWGIAALDFTRIGTSITLGVTLTDGRPAVMRLHPPGTEAAPLHAVQLLQHHLATQGFPAPQPLLEPTPFGVGLATVEGRLFEPPPADPTDREVRRCLADGLAQLVRLARPLAQRVDLAGRDPLGPPLPGSVFPAAAGSPFDLTATSAGAEWIEELGARARAVLDAAPPTTPVIGHFGWRIEHVGLAEGQIVAVFDWSRVGSAPEAIVLGSAAHQFTVDGRSAEPHVPTAEEIQAFVADYEAARGAPLGTQDRVAARATYVFCSAHAARLEHTMAAAGHEAPTRFRELLASTGVALLA